MTCRTIDPSAVATSFRDQLRAELAELPEPLTLVGFRTAEHAPAVTYADWTRRACEQIGIRFDLREVAADRAEAAVREASGDPSVHGILVYYPIGGREPDAWLRELVDPRKDIEGLHSFWARCLYENRRFVDAARTKKAILPCTPMAILKLLDEAGVSRIGERKPLAGVRACVFNRSEVVGFPLAAMMANDGAEVVSFDLDGALLFAPNDDDGAHDTRATTIGRAEALSRADVVITGVPDRAFPLVSAAELAPGAVCLSFSTVKNFDDDVTEVARVFVPRVGPMTVTMALRNTVRLYRNLNG